MADELIDILNNDLSFLKTCLKSEAHTYGHLHASVHIWFYTVDGKILLQKRSSTKTAFPNLWDVSVAGHISAGETAITSAIREIKEEIGLNIDSENLKYIGDFKELHQHKGNFIDNEIHYIYLSKLTKPIDQLKIQKEELLAIKLMPIIDFVNELSKSSFAKTYVPHQPYYYSFVLSEITKRL